MEELQLVERWNEHIAKCLVCTKHGVRVAQAVRHDLSVASVGLPRCEIGAAILRELTAEDTK